MKQASCLQRQWHYLVEQGLSSTEAIEKINSSHFAKERDWQLAEKDLSLGDLGALTKSYQALQAILSQYHEQIAHNPKTSTATLALAQQQQFMAAGWATFRSSFLVSLVYIVVLTALVLFFRLFIGPQFSLIYSEYNSLPSITQLALGPSGLIIMTLLWAIALLYSACTLIISRRVTTFQFLPTFLRYIPVFRRFRKTMNQMMLLASAEFIVKVDITPFPEAKQWQQWFGRLQGKGESWSEACHQWLSFSVELGSFDAALTDQKQKLENTFIDLATRSLKVIALLFSLILGAVIGFFVFAMYAPIFQLGSVL